MLKPLCGNCCFRAKYDQNPRSLLGRLWRWHISFCPGWKLYMRSLSPEEQTLVRKQYSLPEKK
jgi:hypothetical protein